MVDALRRASAGRITAVIPLLTMRAGPSRSFRSCTNHCESGCRLLSSVGVDRVLTVDLHAERFRF